MPEIKSGIPEGTGVPFMEILLATFNGEAHLEEQLDSLFAQSFQDWHLIISDDGSSDKTIDIIRNYQERFPNKIELLLNKGNNLGPCMNFKKLLVHSRARYIMLCDQDDVWLPRKIETTLDRMQELESKYRTEPPLLVFTDLKLVDEHLAPINNSFWKFQRIDPHRTKVRQLIVSNIITGCTILMNDKLRDIAKNIHPQAMMHDWWIAVVAAVAGKIGHLSEQTVLYRQHGRNCLGAKRRSILEKASFILKFGEVHDRLLQTQRQAGGLYGTYKDSFPSNADLTFIREYSHMNQKSFLAKKKFLFKENLLKTSWDKILVWLLY